MDLFPPETPAWPVERLLVSAALLVLTAFGILSAIGAVSTVVVTSRDGYRPVPTRAS